MEYDSVETQLSLPQHHRGPELSPRNTRRANSDLKIQICAAPRPFRSPPSLFFLVPYTSFHFFLFPLRLLSAPQVMRFPPNPFSSSGIITNRLFIRPRLLTSDATSNPASSSHPPYLVPRNSRGTLPVYSDARNGGSRYLISIRNVEGNIKVCDPTPRDRSPLTHITKGFS